MTHLIYHWTAVKTYLCDKKKLDCVGCLSNQQWVQKKLFLPFLKAEMAVQWRKVNPINAVSNYFEGQMLLQVMFKSMMLKNA